MYAHCHNCGWSQDDFWSENYNPIERLQNWEDTLLENGLDEEWSGKYYKTYRAVIADQLRRAARSIENMEWKTTEEMNEDNRECPGMRIKNLPGLTMNEEQFQAIEAMIGYLMNETHAQFYYDLLDDPHKEIDEALNEIETELVKDA